MPATTTTVGASLVLLTTSAHLAIYGAPEMTADDGRTFVPTRAAYSASRHDWTDETSWSLHLVESLGNGGPYIVYEDPANVPLWVPAPPEGWDQGIRIEAERADS